MRHQPSIDRGMPFSPLQLAIVIALHAAVWTALVASDARALAPRAPALLVRMVAPEPLPVAPAPVRREPAPVAKPQPKPAAQPAPRRPAIAAPANAPAPVSAPIVEPAPTPLAIAAPPAPAPAPIAAAAPVVTAPRFDADYLENPAPAYPSASRRLGEEGKVVLRVFVEPDGRPSAVEVKSGSGSTRLDDAALDAVRRWKFLPARRGDQAVGAWVLVPIAFHLKG